MQKVDILKSRYLENECDLGKNFEIFGKTKVRAFRAYIRSIGFGASPGDLFAFENRLFQKSKKNGVPTLGPIFRKIKSL